MLKLSNDKGKVINILVSSDSKDQDCDKILQHVVTRHGNILRHVTHDMVHCGISLFFGILQRHFAIVSGAS